MGRAAVFTDRRAVTAPSVGLSLTSLDIQLANAADRPGCFCGYQEPLPRFFMAAADIYRFYLFKR